MTKAKRFNLPYLAIIFLSLGLNLGVFSAAFAATIEDALPDLVERIRPGVVNVSAVHVIKSTVLGWNEYRGLFKIPQERPQTSLGSGLIIDASGYMLTNYHVIEQADEVMVSLLDQRTLPARIVGRDPKLDLALLQIRDTDGKPAKDLKPVEFGDSDRVRVAETVLAIGNPFGLGHSVSRGIISAAHRTIGVGPYDNFLQTDASINPGNSGGPLFDLKGQVIGINTVILSKTGQSGGLGFAIPINEAKRVLEDLKKYGRVPRPWLGVIGDTLTPQSVAANRLSVSEGVMIYRLARGGPADLSGVRVGDIVTEVAGAPIKQSADIERTLGKLKPNESIELKIIRSRKPVAVKVKLKALPPEFEGVQEGII